MTYNSYMAVLKTNPEMSMPYSCAKNGQVIDHIPYNLAPTIEMSVCYCYWCKDWQESFNDRGDEKQGIKLQRPNIHNLLEAVHYICPS